MEKGCVEVAGGARIKELNRDLLLLPKRVVFKVPAYGGSTPASWYRYIARAETWGGASLTNAYDSIKMKDSCT